MSMDWNCSLLPGLPIFSQRLHNRGSRTCASSWINLIEPACLFCSIPPKGNGKRRGLQRAKFFDDARGSALECAACLDASVAKRITKPDRIHSGKELLLRIVSILTRLVERFDPEEFRIREDGPQFETRLP